MAELMTPSHPRWEEFVERLEGPEGCNFRKNEEGQTCWTCAGGNDQSLARTILQTMDVDVEGSLTFFRERGGHCDCEILWNVEHSWSTEELAAAEQRAANISQDIDQALNLMRDQKKSKEE